MNDDWRVQATLETDRRADEVAARLGRGDLEHALEAQAGSRVAVSVDHHRVFLYTDSRSQAQAAADAIAKLAKAEEFDAELEIRHWHPEADEWEDPDHPLAQARGGLSAGQAELLAAERAESASAGYAEFEVRVELPTHAETLEFARTLHEHRIPYLRRWRFVLIGAADELSARDLAERIERLAPKDSRVIVEGSGAAIMAEVPPNPFAVFGGLGG